MRVAVFVGTLRGGGAERSAVALANELSARGHSVDLVLVRAEGTYLDQGMVSSTVRVVDLDCRRTRHALVPWVRYLRSTRPHSVLSLLTDVNLIAVLGVLLARCGARVVISERAFPSVAEGRFGALQRRLRRWAITGLYRLADGVVCVSRAAAEDLVRFAALPAERVQVIFTPVDTAAVQRRAAAPLEHPWFRSGAPPVLLAVGRLEPQKNFALLLRAFARTREVLDARLVILGEGSERTKLEALVAELGLAEHVSMPGFVDNPYAYMGRAAALALSSDLEGLPNVLLEALACGCPVVSTRCPSGPNEILDEGRYGALVPVGDASALAGALLCALRADSPEDRAHRVERAQEFSPSLAFQRYETALIS